MGIFEDGLALFFDGDFIAVDAEHRPGGNGAGVPVKVILRQPDSLENYGVSQLRMPSTMLDVRIAECERVADRDTFTLVDPCTGRDIVYTVEGAPKRDLERLVWTCGCRGT
jgi:hypothetical protein